MGRTRADTHTPEKRNIRLLPTFNTRTTTRGENGTVSLSPKIPSRTLPTSSPRGRNITLELGGPIIDVQRREVYFLASIDRFSKFPTLKLVTNANGPNKE